MQYCPRREQANTRSALGARIITLKPSFAKLLSRSGRHNGMVTSGKNAKKTSKNAKMSEANSSENRVFGPGRVGPRSAHGITKFALTPLVRTKDFFYTLQPL